MKEQHNMSQIEHKQLVNNLLQFLDETFDNTHGIFLDKDTSLFRTLDTVSAQEASIPVGGKCASLAAQVAHVIFYIESFERLIQGDTTKPDWGYIWRTVETVDDEQWENYKNKLREAYGRMSNLFLNNPIWNEDTIGGALSIIVHSAYHLGEIRQALCVLKK
jgi:hypothetical protein